MKSDITITDGQAKFLRLKFDIEDPNKAIDFLLELMAMENIEIDERTVKLYILKLMQKELKDADKK